jgi:hypothetical protein
VLLENASLNEGGNGDNKEANGAETLGLFVLGSHGFLLHLNLVVVLLLKVLDERLDLGHRILNELGSLVGKFLLLSRGSNLRGLLLDLLGLSMLLHVIVEFLEEVLEIELLEVSTSEVNWGLNRSTSDIHLLGDLRIHFLEPNGLTVQEIVEHEEGGDAVEVSSEGNVGVLLLLEESSDSRSHDEAEHNEREHQRDKAHFEEVVVQTELKLGGLIRWDKVRFDVLPRLVASLCDVASVPPSSGKGADSIDKEDESKEAEDARAASELAGKHVDSKAGELSSLIESSLALGLIAVAGSAASCFEHSARAE